MSNLIVCPKCMGVGETLEPSENNKKLEKTTCNLCKGAGHVTTELAEDFVFSLNEDEGLDE